MKIKVDIISGFLGAGKTTLIKKLVTEKYNNEKVVVIENEFGRVNIDGAVLKNSGIFVQEITSGCICCNLAGDFVSSVMEVSERFKPDRIIIEPTGVALLSEVLQGFRDKRYSDIIQVNNIITVVDVKRFNIRLQISKEFIDNQIRGTKTVILSKTGIATDKQIKEAIEYIECVNSKVNIVNLDWEKVTAEELIDAVEGIKDDKTRDTRTGKIIGGRLYHSSAGDKFETMEFETARGYSRQNITEIFEELASKEKYGYIIRGKGVLKSVDGSYFNFDYVPGEITFGEYFLEDAGKICIIGLELNKGEISRLFS